MLPTELAEGRLNAKAIAVDAVVRITGVGDGVSGKDNAGVVALGFPRGRRVWNLGNVGAPNLITIRQPEPQLEARNVSAPTATRMLHRIRVRAPFKQACARAGGGKGGAWLRAGHTAQKITKTPL